MLCYVLLYFAKRVPCALLPDCCILLCFNAVCSVFVYAFVVYLLRVCSCVALAFSMCSCACCVNLVVLLVSWLGVHSGGYFGARRACKGYVEATEVKTNVEATEMLIEALGTRRSTFERPVSFPLVSLFGTCLNILLHYFAYLSGVGLVSCL